MSLNRFTGIGRIGKDPIIRDTATGKKVASFSICIDSQRKDQEPTWLNVTAWGQVAEFVGNYLSKGRLVSVDGRIQTRKYTAQDGSQREAFEIVAENVNGLDRPRDEIAGGQKGATPAPADDYDPFAEI